MMILKEDFMIVLLIKRKMVKMEFMAWIVITSGLSERRLERVR